MKKIYRFLLFGMVFFPFCANQKNQPQPVSISGREIALSVQLDVLRTACERRLTELEAEAAPKRTIHPVSASEPVHK